MLTDTPTRINLGSGDVPLDGYLNVDLHTIADLNVDFRAGNFTQADEVRMDHSLEHVPWGDVPALLERIRDWLKPGGHIRVEVPDMETIMRFPLDCWELYIYGCQAHEGEYHRSGYTPDSLRQHLERAGFTVTHCETFMSLHPMRTGMPCILAIGEKP